MKGYIKLMVITEKLRQRFAKDIGVPVKIFCEPYFSNMLELYEEHYGAKTKWDQFLTLLENFDSDQAYFAMYNATKDAAINYLADNPEMKYFCQHEDMKKFAPIISGFPTNHIYKCTSVGKHFVSIDMVKGNFTALHHYNPAIVGNKDTYEEFVGMFTEYEYIAKSKYIRQVIFGNKSPKRQTTYEKYLMSKVLYQIMTSSDYLINASHVAYFSTDEIVFDITEFIDDNGNLDARVSSYISAAVEHAKSNNINVRADYFKLYRIKGTSGYMRKYEFETAHKGFDFKCVESDEMPFVIRAYKKEPITESDMVFVYNGRLAKLLEAPKVEFTDVWTPEDERKAKGEENGN